MIHVTKKSGEHYFDVEHNVGRNVYRLVSCNRWRPHPKACDAGIAKVLNRRMDNNDGLAKGRAVLLVRCAQRLLAAVMGLHVEDDGRLIAEIALHSGLDGTMSQQAVSYLVWCARQLAKAPELNDGNEEFYLAVDKRQANVRKCACSVGMTAMPPPKFQLLRRQTMLVYRQSQRAELASGRSKERV